MTGQVLAAAECVYKVVQVGEKPSLQDEFMDFCTSPLPPKVTAIREVDKYWHAISKTRNFYIKFTFNSVIQCSSKML